MATGWYGNMMQYNAQPDIEDDDEDFYNPPETSPNANGDTVAGAPLGDQFGGGCTTAPPPALVPQTPMSPTTAAAKKAHLDSLRAKLIAKMKTSSRPNTPAKAPVKTNTPPSPVAQKMEQQQRVESIDQGNNSILAAAEQSSDDMFGSIEDLLAESKAAAEAKTARDNLAAAEAKRARDVQAAAPAAMVNGSAKKQTPAPIMEPRKIQQEDTEMQEEQPDVTRANRPAPPQPKPNTGPKPTDTKAPVVNSTNPQSTKLSDPYYDDLTVWLEYTGYHDVEFRNSKLATFKERRRLEQEAARIAEALEKLKQAEKADLESLRASTAHPAVVGMAPPPLPVNMPTGNPRPATNGVKRARSPEPPTSDKASRRAIDPGFRIRGADEASGPQSRNPASPLDRRVSFPERRRSIDDARGRDPSLERRLRQYKREDDTEPIHYHDTRTPQREAPRPFYRNNEREDRSFNSMPRGGRGNYNINGVPAFRGSSGLDLRKGDADFAYHAGVRYFMIKSWNHENVQASMADGLWATQEKNEQLLTEAFTTSRHVILLFSVNRSMAFQGYALMTSPPLPSLPKPSFCAKLNWGTSAAFTVQWMAMSPVHFKLVGHLKNTCNPDEGGVPRAVLVGKDGQEISQEAGRGVCEILDEEDGGGVFGEG